MIDVMSGISDGVERRVWSRRGALGRVIGAAGTMAAVTLHAETAVASSTTKRIQNEFTRLKRHPLPGIRVRLAGDKNLFSWRVTMLGPKGSPYEGGSFELTINFPQDYPRVPQTVTFDTKIYHANINPKGKSGICHRELAQEPRAKRATAGLLLSIQALLSEPEIQAGVMSEIASEYASNRAQHDATAREWTATYASAAKGKSNL